LGALPAVYRHHGFVLGVRSSGSCLTLWVSPSRDLRVSVPARNSDSFRSTWSWAEPTQITSPVTSSTALRPREQRGLGLPTIELASDPPSTHSMFNRSSIEPIPTTRSSGVTATSLRGGDPSRTPLRRVRVQLAVGHLGRGVQGACRYRGHGVTVPTAGTWWSPNPPNASGVDLPSGSRPGAVTAFRNVLGRSATHVGCAHARHQELVTLNLPTSCAMGVRDSS
jgi:hypothetical protein